MLELRPDSESLSMQAQRRLHGSEDLFLRTGRRTMSEKNTAGWKQRLSLRILTALGWRIVGRFPDLPKFIIIGAPHTSNWDFFIAMLYMYASGERFNWIGKASLFRWPLGGMARALGGIPVVRERRENFVAQVVAAYERAERMVIVIAPEGTRKNAPYWRSGFYYMAMGAKVPVVMAFLDYKKRLVGAGPLIYPSGDIESDFVFIQAFYQGLQGLHPELQGTLTLKPGEK